MTAASGRTQRTYYFSGRVQGVGFRFTAVQIAARYPVTGFVRNLRDGRVEAVVQGAAQDIDAFAEALRAAFAGHIEHWHAQESTIGEEFSGFDVR